jgi:hypothetical protein
LSRRKPGPKNTAPCSWVNPLDCFAIEPCGSTRKASGRVDGFRRGDGVIFYPARAGRKAGVELAMTGFNPHSPDEAAILSALETVLR